jgi:hypothetical protein
MQNALLEDYLHWYERYVHMFHLGRHFEGRVAQQKPSHVTSAAEYVGNNNTHTYSTMVV